MEIIYSKHFESPGGPEKALVFQANDFSEIALDIALSIKLERLGLSANELVTIIGGNFKDAQEPVDEVLTEGKIIENAKVRIAQFGERQFEVAYCKRSDTSLPAEHELQYRQNGPAFKIIVGLAGEASLSIPKTAEPTGMLYSATKETENVPFKRGTIAIIEAPTAWSFGSSKGGFEYLYISSPKWDPSHDFKAHNPEVK